MFPNLAIIVVNHNLKSDTEQCISSLVSAGARLEQIILVDNGSTDDSQAYLSQVFGPCLTILHTDEVKGYAHGLNLGIEQALREDYLWLLLLSNDTLVDTSFFIGLQSAVRNHIEYKLIGPKILYMENPDRIWFLGNIVLPGTMIARDPYRNKQDQDQYPEIVEVDFLNGCCMLVHQDVIKQVGKLDTAFFMYSEEVDFLWRARRAGYRMAAATKVKMWHKISATMKNDKPGSRYLQIRNQIWVYRRYGTRVQKIIMFLFTIARSFILAIKDLVNARMNLILSLMRGMVDGWCASVPKREE